jgi:hypothetical protein
LCPELVAKTCLEVSGATFDHAFLSTLQEAATIIFAADPDSKENAHLLPDKEKV